MHYHNRHGRKRQGLFAGPAPPPDLNPPHLSPSFFSDFPLDNSPEPDDNVKHDEH
jgi:hypothetical protein